ncbi:MAG: hypothetical protein NTX85_01220 [Candidatus Nomurabacteria bacterium]|nr:hypothetical protein [Candidatus Nomurabacteria bacterium]
MRNITSIIFIVISLGVFIVLVSPLYSNVKKIKSDIVVYNTALSNATNLQKTRDSLLNNYKSISQSDAERLNHFIPNTVDNIQLILQIQKIAKKYSLVLKNIKFDSPSLDKNNQNQQQKTVAISGSKDGLPYGIFNLEFSVDARYGDFNSFLKDLEYNIRLLNIKNISFTVPNQSDKSVKPYDPNSPFESNDPSIYTYSLKIETYWLK